jgi:hypothetical protein
VEQKLLSPVFSGVRVARSLVLCVVFVDYCLNHLTLYEKFEDTKPIIRSHKLKNRKYNEKDKETNNNLQILHTKLKIEQLWV